jgi:hypothetical protein
MVSVQHKSAVDLTAHAVAALTKHYITAEDRQTKAVHDILNYMGRLSAGGNRPPSGMYDRFGPCFAREPRMDSPW